MWEALQEASSVLSTLKQTTPSDRSDVSGNQGIGDRSEIGKKPWEGQAKLLGNLNGQSRGMEGHLDTQGKSSPELYASHKGSTKTNDPGTYTPPVYNRMYKQSINESVSKDTTGIQAGKHKISAAAGAGATGFHSKTAVRGDTNFGGSCNCGKSKPMTEAQLIGSTLAILSANALTEALINAANQE